MHTQIRTPAKPTPLTSSLILESFGILQHRYASGGTLGADGESAEYRKKRLPMQHHAAQQPDLYTTPLIVDDTLGSAGQSLDPGTRAFMEPRFGHDFSQVRGHTDAKAPESARAVLGGRER